MQNGLATDGASASWGYGADWARDEEAQLYNYARVEQKEAPLKVYDIGQFEGKAVEHYICTL